MLKNVSSDGDVARGANRNARAAANHTISVVNQRLEKAGRRDAGCGHANNRIVRDRPALAEKAQIVIQDRELADVPAHDAPGHRQRDGGIAIDRSAGQNLFTVCIGRVLDVKKERVLRGQVSRYSGEDRGVAADMTVAVVAKKSEETAPGRDILGQQCDGGVRNDLASVDKSRAAKG